MNRAELLAASAAALKPEPIGCPELAEPGQEPPVLFVRAMTGTERLRWYHAKEQAGENARGFGLLLAFCLCDSAGALTMTPEDAQAIEGLHGAAVERLCAAANRLNGFSAGEDAKKK